MLLKLKTGKGERKIEIGEDMDGRKESDHGCKMAQERFDLLSLKSSLPSPFSLFSHSYSRLHDNGIEKCCPKWIQLLVDTFASCRRLV